MKRSWWTSCFISVALVVKVLFFSLILEWWKKVVSAGLLFALIAEKAAPHVFSLKIKALRIEIDFSE